MYRTHLAQGKTNRSSRNMGWAEWLIIYLYNRTFDVQRTEFKILPQSVMERTSKMAVILRLLSSSFIENNSLKLTSHANPY